MATTPNKIPDVAFSKLPAKVVSLVDSRKFDGVVDITGQPWVSVDGVMYPIKKTKVSHTIEKPTKPVGIKP